MEAGGIGDQLGAKAGIKDKVSPVKNMTKFQQIVDQHVQLQCTNATLKETVVHSLSYPIPASLFLFLPINLYISLIPFPILFYFYSLVNKVDSHPKVIVYLHYITETNPTFSSVVSVNSNHHQNQLHHSTYNNQPH